MAGKQQEPSKEEMMARQKKNTERRQHVMKEFVTTEGSYLASLNALHTKEDVRNKIKEAKLSQYEKDKVMGYIDNIDKIAETNLKLYAVFVQQEQILNKKDISPEEMKKFEEKMNSLLDTSALLHANAAGSYEKVSSIVGRMNLGSTIDNILIQPIQRFPRYDLLNKDLLKATETEHPFYSHLATRQERIENLAKKIDERGPLEDHIARFNRSIHAGMENLLRDVPNPSKDGLAVYQEFQAAALAIHPNTKFPSDTEVQNYIRMLSQPNSPNANTVQPLKISFADRNARQQAEEIISNFQAILEKNSNAKIGITYSANNEQAEHIYRHAHDGKYRIHGSNQAAVMEQVIKMLKKDPDLQKSVRIFPVATSLKSGGKGEVSQEHVNRDLKHIEKHLRDGWTILGWQNQTTQLDSLAIGGGVSQRVWDDSSQGHKM